MRHASIESYTRTPDSLGLRLTLTVLGLAAMAIVAWPAKSDPLPQISAKTIIWGGCGITKKAFMKELAEAFERKTGTHIELHGGGATKGIRGTADGSLDMGGSCRMTLPETHRSELLVELYPVAWDALAIIVHKDNPVGQLTSSQVKGILSGRVANWKELGGVDAPIHAYSRNGKISGVGYAIRQYLFQDPDQDFDTMYSVKSSGPLEKAVEKDPLAFGITGVSSARRRDVKIIGLDGIEPSYENVRDGNYVMYRPLYLVVPPIPDDEVVKFIKFARSEEAKVILRAHGTVPHGDALPLMKKALVFGIGMK